MAKSSNLIRNLRITALTFGAMIALGYGGIIAYMYFDQDELLYTPSVKNETLPKDLTAEAITLKTPDGITLKALYQAPKPGLPVILFLHGKGHNLSLGKWRYRRMQAEGVGYLAIDYRGFGDSGGKPSENGLYTDALTAYDYLIAQGFKSDQIVIHGHSLGSGVATFLATKRQARALILEAPFTAAVDVAEWRYPWLPVKLLMRDKFESRERMKDIRMPVLIVHGDHDSVIPFAQGEHLFSLANRPKNFVRMIGSDHSTLTRDGVYNIYWHYLGLDTQTAPAKAGAVRARDK